MASLIPSDIDDDLAINAWEFTTLDYTSTMPTETTPPFSNLPTVCSSRDLNILRTTVYQPVTEQVAGRPLRHLDMWRLTCGGHRFMEMGMRTYWKDNVESPRKLRAAQRGYQRNLNPQERKELGKILKQELVDGSIRQVHPSFLAYISPIGIVPKKNGKWRMTWDGRVVNDEQLTIHFKMQTAESVQNVMLPGDFATSIDLKNAFYHMIVDESMQPFLCFEFEGKCYSYMAMPFGSKHSPRLFTEALSFGIDFVRRHWDIRIIQYLDDLLLLHQNRDNLELYTLQIAAYIQCLGWTLSLEKCSLSPQQTIVFLG
jgi:hypothetical protein